MKRNLIAVLFFLVSLMTASCSKLTNGTPIEEYRPIGHYRTISVYNNVNVKLVQSQQLHDIKITCPENLIEKVTTEISGDTLFIKNKNKLNWLRSFDYSIDLVVPFDSLRTIEYASIGNLICEDSICGVRSMLIDTVFDDIDSTLIVSIDTLFPNMLFVNINEGSGDIDLTLNCDMLKNKFGNGTSCVTFRGSVGYSEHVTRSYGLIDAKELLSNFVIVESKSTNDVYVWVKTGLEAILRNIGNVYYKGNPSVVKRCYDKGNVYPL